MSDKKGRLNLYLSSDRNAITDKLTDLVVDTGYNYRIQSKGHSLYL